MSVNKRTVALMACLIATAIALCFVAIHNQSAQEANLEDKLNERMVQMEELKAAHNASETAFNEVRDDAMKEAMGVKGATLTKDMKEIKKVLEPAYSWTSNQEYDAARATLEKTLPEDSPYLERILIDRKEYNRDGTTFNLDEQGLKCYCDNIRIYPAYIADNKNRVYHVVLDYISYKNNAIEKHDHLTVDRQILTVTVNNERQIVDIDLEQCDSIINYRTVK